MKAKPFVKWVGGKTQLIDQLEAMLPADFDQWENVTYIEPFVVFFVSFPVLPLAHAKG